jgi:hypothetical protein
MSVVFELSICTAIANSCSLGYGNVLLSFFLEGGGGSVCIRWLVLHVPAEKMKIYSYIHIGKIHTHRMFPKGWTISQSLYSRIYLISHPQDWTGARLLNIPFIKLHLY